jgi:surface protein
LDLSRPLFFLGINYSKNTNEIIVMTLPRLSKSFRLSMLCSVVLISTGILLMPNDTLGQAFITTWKTDNPGTSGPTSITIPTIPWLDYNYDVDWNNDGVFDEFAISGDATHDFGIAGTYTIGIRGNFPAIYFRNSGDKEKILSIDQWGNIAWGSMYNAFFGAKNLTSNATDSPDLSNVTDMSNMFREARAFNGDVSNWDVGNVTNMSSTFSSANLFNGDVSGWDVSNVTNMLALFSGTSFNGNVSSWDVSQVTNMRGLFRSTPFDGDVSGWDVGQVNDMAYMFQSAVSFNADLSGWDVSNVKNMQGMFYGATLFNGNVSSWDVSNVKDMAKMFSYATSFNRELNSWDVGNVKDMYEMFSHATLFNHDLNSWDVSKVIYMNGMFSNATSFNGNISTWDVSRVTNMAGKFEHASSFNGDLSAWDVGQVQWMHKMFEWAKSFNSDLSNWDVSNVKRMDYMFHGAISFNSDLTNWDVTSVNRIQNMFWVATSFNGDLSGWDVSNVTDMRSLFYGAYSFNRDLSSWDVSQVTNMQHMFAAADSFNGDISNWDVGNVANMIGMFWGASSFNGDLSSWDVGNVVNMTQMFDGASSFSSDLSGWGVAKVTTMEAMFRDASSFCADLSSWDVSQVTNMSEMFKNASLFTSDLASWDISAVTDISGMLDDSGLRIDNYDNTLIGWESQGVSGLSLGANSLFYCVSELKRESLINNYGWTISGDNKDCGSFLEPFISIWETHHPGSTPPTGITIPTLGGPGALNYNYDVDWDNDGIFDQFGITGDVTHDFGEPGTYTIRIRGDFPGFFFNNGGDMEKIISIEQWGDIAWGTMYNAFAGARNLTCNATDAPDLSGVTSLAGMFSNAVSFNGDLSGWDVSNVTNMSKMFHNASAFNGDLSGWQVGNVTNMKEMFFNASSFNADISGWDVSNVMNMSRMFYGASIFNSNIGGWNTVNVTDMSAMFLAAGAFNHNLGQWNISLIGNMSDMLNLSGLSVLNYDNTLIGWETQGVFGQNLGNTFPLVYCDCEPERNSLINEYGWTITGDQMDCSGYDNQPPVAICNPVIVEANINCQALAIAEDFDGGSYDPDEDELSLSVNPAGPYPLSTTMVILTVTDPNGEADQCKTLITVEDTEPPGMEKPCPDNITLCGAQNVSWNPPTATDNCGIVSSTSSYDPGSFFDVGDHQVNYNFFDAAGLSTNCSFSITINAAPEIEIMQSDLPTWCQGIQMLTAKIANADELQYPLTFEWSDHPVDDPLVVASANGTYSVRVTDSRDCFAETTTLVDEDISSLLSAYTLIAEDELEMHESEVHGGGVGIENAEEAEIEDNSSVFSFLRADSDHVSIDASSYVNEMIDEDFDSDLPNFRFNPFKDYNNLIIPANTIMTLSGNRYGYVYVSSGATLIIQSPEIFIQRLTSGFGASIIFNQPTEMMIRRKMSLGKNNTINPGGYPSIIYVGDEVTVREGSTLTVNIFASEDLEVNETGNQEVTYMTGMFIGEEINSGENVVWNWSLNCDNLSPSPDNYTFSSIIDQTALENEITETAKIGSNELNIYPNPTTGLINIEVPQFIGQKISYKVFDYLGREVLSHKYGQLEWPEITVDLSFKQFSNGVYQIAIQGEKEIKSIRFVLNK